MIYSELSFANMNNFKIVYHKWTLEKGIKVKGVLLIIHGLAEHAMRYEIMADAVTKEGYICYVPDCRGHGKTIGNEKPGWLGNGGMSEFLQDIRQMIDIITHDNPKLPLFIYGHSNGSFYAQDLMEESGSKYKGIILSGTAGKQAFLNVSKLLEKTIRLFRKPEDTSGFAYNLAVGVFNKPFKNEKTVNAWISSKKDVVKKYNEDPLCGFRPPNQYFFEIAELLKKIWKPQNEAKIPKELPIFITQGEYDPLSKFGKMLIPLIERYKKLGLKNVKYKVYANARHEAHNDITQDEYLADIVNFLNNNIKKS